MPFDWKKYLELARFLQSYHGNEIDGEAARRCAVSRAYYAAFCHARHYLEVNFGFIPSKTRVDHRDVRDFLKLQARRNLTITANKLETLARWREQCDYNDVVLKLPTILVEAIQQAQSVLDELKT